MTLLAPTYDLVLLLDPQAEEPMRAKIVADASEAIAAKGELMRHDEWGERALAYPIDHKATAEYHLLQFHARAVELIAELSRTLHITDGVIRFRINKLKPGTPAAPDMTPGAAPPAREETEQARGATTPPAREETQQAPGATPPAGEETAHAPVEEQAVA